MGKKKSKGKKLSKEIKAARSAIRLIFAGGGTVVAAAPLIQGVAKSTSNFTQSPNIKGLPLDIAREYGLDPANFDLVKAVIGLFVLPLAGVQIGKVGGKLAAMLN